MKVSTRVRGEWLQIPCKDGKGTIKWLGQEAWRRYEKLMQGRKNIEDGLPQKVGVQEVRKTRGGAILDPDDIIIEVLDDDDFVNIGDIWFGNHSSPEDEHDCLKQYIEWKPK